MRLADLYEQTRQHLYHGTMLINALHILKSGFIRGYTDEYGKPEGVSLSRSYDTAMKFTAYNANMEEPYPVIFVIDWDKLRLKGRKIEPFFFGADEYEFDPLLFKQKEQEEVAHGDIPLDYVISINADPRELELASKDKAWMTDEGLTPQEIAIGLRALARHPLLNRVIPRAAARHVRADL